jgi:hypothetical protein
MGEKMRRLLDHMMAQREDNRIRELLDKSKTSTQILQNTIK